MSSDILAGCALDGDGSLKNNSPQVPRAVSAESLDSKKEVRVWYKYVIKFGIDAQHTGGVKFSEKEVYILVDVSARNK